METPQSITIYSTHYRCYKIIVALVYATVALQGHTTHAKYFTTPSVVSVGIPTNATYTNGAELEFDIFFDEPVNVIGMPDLALTIGDETVAALFDSGSGSSRLVFIYTVQAGDSDPDGIEIGAIDLSGATIRDFSDDDADLTLNNVENTSGVLVDGVMPAITSVNVPPDSTYVAAGELNFRVNFDDNVLVFGSPVLEVTIGTSTVEAIYTGGAFTTSMPFTYTVQAGELDTDGITLSSVSLNGGSIKDVVGNNADLTLSNVGDLSSVFVDAIGPVVTAVSVPPNDSYSLGENLELTIDFDELVNVSGFPDLSFIIGSSTVNASLIGGNGTSSLSFAYTVQAGELDLDGLAIGTLMLNGGSIEDLSGNEADLTLNNVADASNVLVDAIVPQIVSVDVPVAGTYLAGQTLDFTVNFDEVVGVIEVPLLFVAIGTNIVGASFASGSGNNSLIFSYVVQSGDFDSDGIALIALELNTGTIQDLAGNDADLTLNNIDDLTGVLIDAMDPQITITSTSEDPTSDSPIEIAVTFSESVTGFSDTDLMVVGGAISSFNGVGDAYTFDLTPNSEGIITIDIAADVAFDNAGNGNEAATQFQIESDQTPPSGYTVQMELSGESEINMENQANISFSIAGGEVGALLTYEFRGSGGTTISGTATVFSTEQTFDNTGAGYDLSSFSDGAVILTITLTDPAGNEGPASVDMNVKSTIPVIVPSQVFNIDENVANGFSVGFVQAMEASSSVLTDWTIVGGNDAGVFTVNTSTGELSILDSTDLDFESTPQYNVSLTVSNGVNISDQEEIVVMLNDVNDNSPLILPNQTFTVAENAPNGEIIGTIAASDEDLNTIFSDWSLMSGNELGIFSLNPATGDISILNNQELDFERISQVDLFVTVSDGLNDALSGLVSVLITDENDNAPVITPEQTLILSPSYTLGTSLGLVEATDVDLGTSLSDWIILDGNSENLFAIAPGGEVIVATSNEIEEQSYQLQLTVSDGLNTSDMEIVSIEFGDEDPPSVVLSANVSDVTNLGSQTIMATFSESVTGFDGNDILVQNGAIANLSTNDSAMFTFDVLVDNQGVVTITIPEGIATDAALNPNLASNTISFFYDNTPPIISIEPNVTVTNQLFRSVMITFSEEIQGFSISDIGTTNANITDFEGSGAFYTLDIVSAEGVAAITIAEGAVRDLAGNGNESFSFPWTVDQTPPDNYSVNILDVAISSFNQQNLRFEIVNAEENASYAYTIINEDTVSGQGMITDPAQTIIEGVDVSPLRDGTLTLVVNVVDEAGNMGPEATDEIIKNTEIDIPQGFNPNLENWIIPGIENFPDNRVVIFNRFGTKVWQAEGYNNEDKSWNGFANSGGALGKSGAPDGTYFYLLEFLDGAFASKSGFVIIKR